MSTFEPLPDVKVGDRDGWKAFGFRRHRGHTIKERIGGVFTSWIDADQACDAYHRQHRNSIRCDIEPNHKPEGE